MYVCYDRSLKTPGTDITVYAINDKYLRVEFSRVQLTVKVYLYVLQYIKLYYTILYSMLCTQHAKK